VLALKKIQPLLVALILPASTIAQSSQAPNTADAYPVKLLLFDFDVYRFGTVVEKLAIWRLGEADSAFFFSAGVAIDADAPNANNPENTGLDDLSNAGHPGHRDGIVQDWDGNPLVQGPDDLFPGYYISCTSLADWSKGSRFDPTRFVDAPKIPYIALPGDLARATGAHLGDFAAVFNMRKGRFSDAIFADIGALGEGSIAPADNLGIWSDARAGGAWSGIVYIVFPASGDYRPKAVEDINDNASKVFQDWGGADRIRSCADVVTWRRRPSAAVPTPWDPQPIRVPINRETESKPGASSDAA
jgi:hypothetical protein